MIWLKDTVKRNILQRPLNERLAETRFDEFLQTDELLRRAAIGVAPLINRIV